MTIDEALIQLSDGNKHAIELDTSKLPKGYAGDFFDKDIEMALSKVGIAKAWLYKKHRGERIRILFREEDGWDSKVDDVAFDVEIEAASFIPTISQDVELLI